MGGLSLSVLPTTAHSSRSGALLSSSRLLTLEECRRQGTEKAVPVLGSPFYQAPGTPLQPPGRTPDAPLQQSNQRFITWRTPTPPAHSQDELSHPTGVRRSAPAWGPPCLVRTARRSIFPHDRCPGLAQCPSIPQVPLLPEDYTGLLTTSPSGA